ncbi:MAG: toprim domain-containing protein [Candidatus Bathycorpusculaceae bacterium]
MLAHLKEKEEKILQILEQLAEETRKGTPIIVEGKRDIETLKTLNVEAKIISAKTGGKSLLDIISELEKTQTPKVILLLDFDRRGRELTKNLEKHFERMGIEVNLKFWRGLLGLVGKELKDVEGLASYIETLKKKISNS